MKWPAHKLFAAVNGPKKDSKRGKVNTHQATNNVMAKKYPNRKLFHKFMKKTVCLRFVCAPVFELGVKKCGVDLSEQSTT